MTSNCPTNVGCGHYKSAASSLYSMHVHTGSFGLSVSFCGELGKPTGNAGHLYLDNQSYLPKRIDSASSGL